MTARRRLYGRQQGRPLRPQRKALLTSLLPRLAVTLPPPGGRLEPARLFGRWAPLWLEIGFGGGEHLAWQARHNPAVDLLGAEYFINGIAGLLRQLDAEQLSNVRIHHGHGEDLLAALPEASVARLFLLFPDPWPKARHHKRRFVQEPSLDQAARVLEDGAELRLATDDSGYLTWMLEHLARHPAFRWRASGPADWRTRPADWPATRYEEKALARGLRPAYLRFLRCPRAA
ncbi:MAG: tRNA (guanosine(46)-N7)-methyltransferase TrmB [Kiloniellales bacterium]